MYTRRELPLVAGNGTDAGVADFISSADVAVLVVTLTTCDACAAYETDVLEHWPAAEHAGVALGKVVLDGPGGVRFRRDNPWVDDLDFLPYTLLYVRGVAVEEFATAHAAYLLERVRAADGRG
jgi:hypothetical protein